jgi:hypothetical protein
MAVLAGCGEAGGAVVGRSIIEVCLMAEETVRGRALELTVHVAKVAGRVDVRPRQRKSGIIVVKCRRIPCHGRMTGCAIVIELACHVIRIGHSVEVRLMTSVAIGSRLIIRPARMTRHASQRNVRSGKRERRVAVMEVRWLPAGGRMAAAADMVETSDGMRRIVRPFIIVTVAKIAFIRGAGKSSATMTGVALRGCM